MSQPPLRDYRDRLDNARAESRKLAAERKKLIAEDAKRDRDRCLGLWVLLTSLSSGVVVAVISHFWR